MLGLFGNERLLVGYDLGDRYSQISYCVAKDAEIETLSGVAGQEQFNIPTALCKREGVNQWYCGREAYAHAGEPGGILVEGILQKALDAEPLLIDGSAVNPVSLLTLFLKRSLGLLGQVGSPDKIYAMTITCQNLDGRCLEVLREAVAGLRLKTDRIYFQSHMESYYDYMIRQPAELWTNQSLLCEYQDNSLLWYRMECNPRTIPTVVYMERIETPFPPFDPMPEDELLRNKRMEMLDEEFAARAEEVCGDYPINSVYLIGDQFRETWMKKSLRVICKGRRVFQGNNLYSKGACVNVLERLDKSAEGENHVFLGNEKLKANVGMKLLRQGEESYYALLDAGVNWFEVAHTMECYVQDADRLVFVITPLIGGAAREVELPLEGFPARVARVELRLYLRSEFDLVAEVEDLGFGAFREPSGMTWSAEFPLLEE